LPTLVVLSPAYSSTMPPKNATAPALPDAQAVKAAKGKIMRKKSDNMLAAETARRESVEIRVDWAKLAGVKSTSKGKGKGKGKKDKGKGKGSGKKYVVKKVAATEEERAAAVEKLEKKGEKKRRDSITEMVKIEEMINPKPKKPKFKKIKNVQPEAKGLNLMLKCVKCESIGDSTWEAVCGDDTGIVTFSLRNQEHVDVCKAGASVRVQNAKVIMAKGFVRIIVDKWAVMKAADEACTFEVLASNDLSATEYELSA